MPDLKRTSLTKLKLICPVPDSIRAAAGLILHSSAETPVQDPARLDFSTQQHSFLQINKSIVEESNRARHRKYGTIYGKANLKQRFS